MAYGSLFSTKLIADGQYAEAVEASGREIAASPGDPEPYFNRARGWAGLERWEDAVRDYQRALEHDAGASAIDPAEIDDELFFALRRWAESERDRDHDPARAIGLLDRYATLCPDGRHLLDLETWRDHLRGVKKVWVREAL
ncbi:MAG: tetratricopeptide repeat protein [Bacteroidota bacterium]